MNKRILFIFIFLSCIISSLKIDSHLNDESLVIDDIQDNITKANINHNKAKPKIVLQSKLLHLIDGVKGAMDELRMRQIMNTGRRVVKHQFGIPDAKNKSKRIGTINYKSHWYTLLDIVKLEEEYIKKTNSKNPLEDKYINDLFKISAIQFREIVTPYLEEVKKFKPITTKLIEEFCQRTNKPSSYLRRWKEGDDEERLFYKYIRSNKQLFVFCSDLTYFLSSMIESCPKAYKQYLDWKNKVSTKDKKPNKINKNILKR